jgi:hypothetical protein
MKNQHLLMTEISHKERKEANSSKERHVERQRNISFFEAFSMRRSFAFAQDDDNEMCGAGKAERAERSGLPRFFFGYFLCSNDKESDNKILKMMTSCGRNNINDRTFLNFPRTAMPSKMKFNTSKKCWII